MRTVAVDIDGTFTDFVGSDSETPRARRRDVRPVTTKGFRDAV